MNFVFIIIAIVLCVAGFLLESSLYRPLGRYAYRILKDIKYVVSK